MLDSTIKILYDFSFMILNPSATWIDFEAFITFCEKEGVNGLTRLVLASDGSVTRLLEVLSLLPVEVEVLSNQESVLDQEAAAFLELGPHFPAINRKVYLKTRQMPLVYASSMIPLEGLSRPFYNELLKQKKSIGNLLGEYHYSALRDKMGFAWGPCPGIPSGFGIAPTETVWSRRYRLKVDRILQAYITEVFSPKLFEFH